MVFIHRHADYLNQFDSIAKYKSIVKKVCRLIRQSKIEFSHIAVAGVSGMTIGGPVALRLKKNLIVVRKEEDCHSDCQVEGIPANNKQFGYIIIDDCIDSGKTVFNIYSAINKMNNQAVPLSIFQYLYRDIKQYNIGGVVDNYQRYIVNRKWKE